MRPAAAGARLGLAIAIAIAVLGGVPPAGAHTSTPGVHNVIDGVTPAVAGVSFAVDHSVADQLEAAVTGSATIEVMAPSGEPFLRLTRDSVEANVESVSWFASESLDVNPITSVAGVDPAFGPRWVKVSDGGRWAWFDPRLRPDQPADALGAGGARGPRRLASWAVPISADGRPAAVRGHREFLPVRGTYEQQLESSESPFPGVRVAVVGGSSVPAAYVDDEVSEPVTVLGADDEPFLQIGPGGTQANTASPSWLLAAATRDEAPAAVVSAAAPPRWKLVAGGHQFSWLDNRGQTPPGDPTSKVDQPHRVGSWGFTLVEGGRRAQVSVGIVWQPAAIPPAALGPAAPSKRSSLGPVVVVGVAVAVVAALGACAVAFRRRGSTMPR